MCAVSDLFDIFPFRVTQLSEQRTDESDHLQLYGVFWCSLATSILFHVSFSLVTSILFHVSLSLVTSILFHVSFSSAFLFLFTCCCDQMLNGIEENYGVTLDLSTEGRAVVFSDHADSVKKAVKLVRELVHEIQEVKASAIQQETN